MDYQLLTRVQSHAADLFKLSEELNEKEDEEDEKQISKVTKKQAKQSRPLSPPLPKREEQLSFGRAPPRSKSVPFSLSTLVEEDSLDDEYELPNREEVASPPQSKAPAIAVAPPTTVQSQLAQASHARSSPILGGRKSPAPGLKKSKGGDIFQTWIAMRRLSVEEQKKIHYEDLFGCFTRNFGKGFALGFGGKVLLNVFSELISLIRNARKPSLHMLWHCGDGGKDHGLFFALLLATHNSIMYMSRDSNHAKAWYRGSVAGFIAGLVSLVYLPNSMKRSVILFTSVRAFEIACRILVKRKDLPGFVHGDTALMSLSSAFMIYTWLFHPKALDPSYVHFLQRQVQVPAPIVRGIANCQAGVPLENLDALNAARQAMAPRGRTIEKLTDPLGYDSALYSAADKAGIILHPGQTFSDFTGRYFIKGIKNAAPVYAPVYAVPLLLFSRKRLIRDPFNTLKSAALGASRSTLFLATYCTIGIASLSLGRRLGFRYDVVGSFAKTLPFIVGALAGTSALIEKKQRRIELALYVMSKAVEGLYNIFKDKVGERIAAPLGGDALLFACCFSIICHANLRHPELVRESYRALLMRFFDTDERHKFF